MRSLFSAATQSVSDDTPPATDWGAPTIYGEVTEGSARCALNLSVMRGEKEEDRVESVAADRADLLLGDLSKGKGR
jgi:hypothetical protein